MSIMTRWIRCLGVHRGGMEGGWMGVLLLLACLVFLISSASLNLEFWDAAVCQQTLRRS